ncbi:hypothetical protein [Burkholderia pyrrocinia]|uniref:hypothetical protein n=1 Tax=Burkholderia pyrrocinia TaxID=60550 RepID=UPI00104EA283|nr:hypothetical protein [Burkholderia pyrrocinia]TDA49046.1 hypothetical protein EVG18_01995 [Burkholderia pyrrocinia]
MRLQDYPSDMRIQIGDRIFRRESYGTFWREESPIPGNCVSRPSVSLLTIESSIGEKHVVLSQSAN